jgi:spermidine synthase
MLRRILSFFIPVNVAKRSSVISKSLEVTYNNGRLVLDSSNTNYSFGTLQRVLRYGLNVIGFDHIRTMKEILVLGVAGGSVINTLCKEIRYSGKITGVEIDPDVITLAKQYFGLDQFSNLKIVIADAFEFALQTKIRYDLIIVDVFCDASMPSFLFEKHFGNRLVYLLNPGGHLLFNTMILSAEDEKRNTYYVEQMTDTALEIRRLRRIEEHNELFVIEKLKPAFLPEV